MKNTRYKHRLQKFFSVHTRKLLDEISKSVIVIPLIALNNFIVFKAAFPEASLFGSFNLFLESAGFA